MDDVEYAGQRKIHKFEMQAVKTGIGRFPTWSQNYQTSCPACNVRTSNNIITQFMYSIYGSITHEKSLATLS